jgi:hypothetical protein
MGDQEYKAALARCAKAFAEAERLQTEADATRKPDKVVQSYSVASRVYKGTSALMRTVKLMASHNSNRR